MKKVRFIIRKNGKTDVEALGFSGDGCKQAVDNILDHLKSSNVVDSQVKSEYGETVPALDTEIG